jgi:RHS repeat-associated protein
MSIAAKHMDPILGVDVHIILIPTPAGPVPTPLPNPFVGMVLDPMDYIPFIGATVVINGMKRGQAGTAGIAVVPHLPLGGPFAPPPPGNEAEIFMGSATVASDGDAQSRLGMMALSCQSIGMPCPPRAKGQPGKSLMLPTSVVLSIPMGPLVLVGGPPTVTLMSLGMSFAMAFAGPLLALLRRAQRGGGRFGRAMRAIAERARAAGRRAAGALGLGDDAVRRIDNAICTVTGHPVDVATGKVFTEKIDLTLSGPIHFEWKRIWYSTSTYDGPMGHGWHHSYDAGLYVLEDVILYRTPDGRFICFPPLKEGQEHFDRTERLTLIRTPGKYDGEYSVRAIAGTTHRFRELRKQQRQHHATDRGGHVDPREHVLTGIHAPSGQTLTFAYDASGRLSDIIDASGRLLQLSYDRNGRVTAITAPHPEEEDQRIIVVQYVYDSSGNLVQTVDALGQPTSYAYDRRLLVKETDRNGLSFYFKYDRHDDHAKCLRTWGDGGIYDHSLRYDAGLTVVRDSLGFTTQHEHNGALVTRTIDAAGGVSTYEYNDHNERVKEVDPVGGVSTYAYDERGNTIATVQPDGSELRVEYESDRPVRGRGPIGDVWQWRYDELGRLIERIDPLGHSTRFSYQGTQIAALTDGVGNTTAFEYDGSGNLIGIHAPQAISNRRRYDRLGRVTALIDAAGNEERRHYDALGRVTRIEEADANVRVLEYDGEANVLRVADAHHDVAFRYSGMGRLVSRSEAGTTVRFEYDTEEQLTAIANEHGRVYKFELGPTGYTLVEHGYDGVRKRYQRDAAGRVLAIERPSGLTTTLSYDKAGRILEFAHSDGTKEAYTYRRDGQLIGARNQSAALTFELDALGQILKETQNKHWVESRYDARGERIEVRSSKGAHQQIRVGPNGDVEEVKLPSQGYTTQHRYDALGFELQRDLPGGLRVRWQRDRLGRATAQEALHNDQVLSARGYQWDVDERLIRTIHPTRGPVQYDHDALGSLARALYSDGRVDLRMPDAVGNLFRTEQRTDRVYGPSGQLLEMHDARGTTAYRYDVEGNLIEKRTPLGDIWQYCWNGVGRLVEVIRPDGQSVRFEYDPLGRRVNKTFAGVTTYWIWDGNVPLHEWAVAVRPAPSAAAAPRLDDVIATQKQRDAQLAPRSAQGPPPAGGELVTWQFFPDTFVPMTKVVGSDCLSVVADVSGAPIALLAADGRRAWSAELDCYGRVDRIEGEREVCPFRWPGQYEDTETGLYYNRHRYYDPETGLHVSQDPIGLEGGIALYAYVHDPLTWNDPFGLAACHGNSRANGRANHVYVIRDRHTGEVHKYGISGGRVRADGRSSRAEAQVRRLNAKPGNADRYESTIVGNNLTRDRALSMEQGRVNGYSVSRQNAGLATGPTAPPGNTRPTAKM